MDDYDPIAIIYRAEPGGRGQPAITIARLARLKGWTTRRAQTVVARLDPPVAPLPEPLDGRTPLYPLRELLRAIDARPGRPGQRKP